MSDDKLHPSLEEFKKFMNARPNLVLELRKNGDSLQSYYNKWSEYGEDDSIWGLESEQYHKKDDNVKKTDIKYSDLFDQIMKYTENMDLNKLQGHVKQFNKVLETIQLMLGDFTNQKNTNKPSNKQSDLFSLFRD